MSTEVTIPVTQQMIDVYDEAWQATPRGKAGARRHAGLTAVLALVAPLVNELIDARDIARTEAFLLDGEIHTLRVTNQEQADELANLVTRVKRVRAVLPVSSPVVLVAQVRDALDGVDKAAALNVAQS